MRAVATRSASSFTTRNNRLRQARKSRRRQPVIAARAHLANEPDQLGLIREIKPFCDRSGRILVLAHVRLMTFSLPVTPAQDRFPGPNIEVTDAASRQR